MRNDTLGHFLAVELPWTIPVEWFAGGGVHVIDHDRRAEIDATTHRTQGEYEGVTVKIVSKTGGPVTARTFLFDDYLDTTDRSDDAVERHQPRRPNPTFHVTTHVGIKWFIAVPAYPAPFSEAVEQFIGLYR